MKQIVILWLSFSALCLNAQVNLDSLLLAHWMLDGEATDATTNGNHGTLQGPVPAADLYGNPDGAFQFDGVDDHIQIPTLWDSSPDGLTFSTWFLVDDPLIDRKLIYHGDNGEFELMNSSGQVIAGVHLTNSLWYYVSAGSIVGNGWHFAAGRWTTGEKLRLYLDGAFVDSLDTPAGTLLDVGANYQASLGSYNRTVSSFFNGVLDDVRVYSRSLSTEELDSLYQGAFTFIAEGGNAGDVFLFRNGPNPTNGNTVFSFSLPSEGRTVLRLFDPMGREVAELVNATLPAGEHRYAMELKGLSAGAYLCVLQNGTARVTRNLVVQ